MGKTQKSGASEFPAFDDYLKERDLYERVSIAAEKMIIARQLAEEMREQNLSKSSMAEMMGTSRAQLDRVLNPKEQNVTLETLGRAARAVGRRLRVELI
ncbi:helix-turn-helix domain-containing protein [Sphingomonas sp.]|uniref:helix-turn-helix domain-containing protein n=1 Tax=Sphingomonas sp. TaxID=28214 RepID=UPI002FCC28B4